MTLAAWGPTVDLTLRLDVLALTDAGTMAHPSDRDGTGWASAGMNSSTSSPPEWMPACTKPSDVYSANADMLSGATRRRMERHPGMEASRSSADDSAALPRPRPWKRLPIASQPSHHRDASRGSGCTT